MGRRLERTLHVVDLLRATLVEPRADEAAALDALLDVADSSMTYRRRYLGAALAAPVLDLLLVDETNPRGSSSSSASSRSTSAICRAPRPRPSRSAEERLAAGALARVRLADVERLAVVAPDGTRARARRAPREPGRGPARASPTC